jgi:hypothetical protein
VVLLVLDELLLQEKNRTAAKKGNKDLNKLVFIMLLVSINIRIVVELGW